jgi:hypothetical protein
VDTDVRSLNRTGTRTSVATVELWWIPLGAGQRVVQASGRLFEALSALLQRRRPCDLYHSALVVAVPEGRFVIEMTPAMGGARERRGVVAEGTVGTKLAGRFRAFRYEIRCWRNGVIPDAAHAVSTQSVSVDSANAQRLLALVSTVPIPVWGRDEFGAGEMWNSNSVTAWLLTCSGVDMQQIAFPEHGRAPGWGAGCVVASRR